MEQRPGTFILFLYVVFLHLFTYPREGSLAIILIARLRRRPALIVYCTINGATALTCWPSSAEACTRTR